MKIIKYTLIIIIIFNSFLLFSQTSKIGVNIGLLTSKIKTNIIDYNQTEYKLGYTGGINYEYSLNNNFAIETNADYIQKGYYDDIAIIDENGNILNNDKLKYNSNYFSLNILGKAYVGNNKIKGYFKIGINPSYLINSILKVDIEPYKIDLIEDMNRIELGVHSGTGIMYSVDKISYFLEFIYNRSFIPFTSDYYNYKMYNYYYGLSFGIKYNIN